MIEGPGHEVDQPPPPSIEVKNKWNHTSTPPVCLHRINMDKIMLPFFF